MSEPIVLSEGQLDFRPHEADLPDTPGPWRALWSLKLPVKPGQSRLLNFKGITVLVNAPAGITALTTAPPGEKRMLPDANLAARAALEDGAVLFDDAGRIYRWTPGETPQHVWDAGEAGTRIEVIALASMRLLLQRASVRSRSKKAGTPWIMELAQPASGTLWRNNGDLRGVIPSEEELFAFRGSRREIVRLNPATGTTEWEQTVGGRVSSLVAIVEGKLWLTTYEGEIVAMRVETGTIEARRRYENIAVPDGVVDSSGKFHLCTGAAYTIVDLRATGTIVATGNLASGEQAPSAVFGGAAIPTTDGRLIFSDRQGRIFSARAGRANSVTLLWHSAVPLLDFRAAYGMLFVLARNGVLSAIHP